MNSVSKLLNLILLASIQFQLQGQEVSRDILIAQAVAAAPETFRDGAEVRAHKKDGGLWTVREGNNEMICIADIPGDERFASACYHVSLESFMQRGRELSEMGLKGIERQEHRWREVDEGKISMPNAAMVYNLLGEVKNFDSTTLHMEEGTRVHATYIPYATVESTGLSPEPNQGGPWIMFSGKPSAHIMFSFKGNSEKEQHK